jgi:peptidoglycan/xylan/chitin deacetylase (PgdA/CDA1 family)
MPHCCGARVVGRDEFLALLGVGLLGALGACGGRRPPVVTARLTPSTPPTATSSTTSPSTTSTTTRPTLPPIPPPRPGSPRVVSGGNPVTGKVALTIDEGYCKECIDGYVEIARRTGIALTFSPNGVFGTLWEPHAAVLRPLIATGQVQIGNHTWSHPNLTALGTTGVRHQIARNEAWIEDTFGITARPYLRPPYGSHDRRIDEIAGEMGFTTILMWNGTLGDATVETPRELLGNALRWVRPGAIMLGHANHPTVLGVFDQVASLIAQRSLVPVTVDAMLGTSRAEGVSAAVPPTGSRPVPTEPEPIPTAQSTAVPYR